MGATTKLGHIRAADYTLRAACVAVSAVCILPRPAHAGDWTFTPSVGVLETYTTNVGLAPSGGEHSDYVTQISPGLDIAHQGPNLKVKASYTMNNISYARAETSVSRFHQLNALANAEVLQDLFFFDTRATIHQTNVSPFGPQSTNNLNLTNNRTEVRTYNFTPYVRHKFDQFASAELHYAHDHVDSSTAGLLQDNTDRVQLDIASGSTFRTLAWNLSYNKQTLHFRNSSDVDLGMGSATLRYIASQELTFSGTAGYEKNTYTSVAGDPAGAFWLVGVTWQPTTRTSIDAKAGKRFYGNTAALAASHRTQRSTWSLGYNEEISTTPSEFTVPTSANTSDFLNTLWKTSIPDATVRQQVIDNFIKNTGLPAFLPQSVNLMTNRVFLQKSLNGSVAYNTAKTTTLLSVFNTTRQAQSSADSDVDFLGSTQALLVENTRQVGINTVINWHPTERTGINLSFGQSRARSISLGRTDTSKTASLALTRSFQPKTRGSIEVRRRLQTSNQAVGNISESAVAASLQVSF